MFNTMYQLSSTTTSTIVYVTTKNIGLTRICKLCSALNRNGADYAISAIVPGDHKVEDNAQHITISFP